MVLMYSRTLSSPSASIFCGVSATANSARVARLTPASVACADSTTATRSVKGLRCSSSPFGSGLALRKRLKASRTSAAVQGFGLANFLANFWAGFLADFFAAGLGSGLAGFFAGCFGADRTADFLARWERMLLAIIRVY